MRLQAGGTGTESAGRVAGVTPWPWRIGGEWGDEDGQWWCLIGDACYQGEVVGPSVRIEDARIILRAIERQILVDPELAALLGVGRDESSG